MKKFLLIFIAVFIMSGVITPVALSVTDAELQQKIDATRRERDLLLEQQKKLQVALDEISRESATLTGTVKNLDTARAKIAADLKVTQANINASNLTIQKLERDISKNESAITAHRAAIKESLQKLKSYDSYSMVYALLAYSTLDEVWRDTSNIQDLQTKLSEEIAELETTQESLLRNRTERERKQVELLSLSRELKGQKQVADETRNAQARILAETKQKEAEYQKMLAENRAREEEFEEQLKQFESQIKAADRSTIAIPKKGVLSWPLDKVTVTQYFGYTAAARLLYPGAKHNGIDLRASVGTRVLATRGGIIKGMGNTDEQRGCYSYGRWILIEHDNGLSSLYAHLSAATVTTGQVVATGDVIGYTGGQPRAYGSGASTGPHLHLGVYATAGVKISQYVSSQNCKNVSIPLANPQDYLDPIAYLPAA